MFHCISGTSSSSQPSHPFPKGLHCAASTGTGPSHSSWDLSLTPTLGACFLPGHGDPSATGFREMFSWSPPVILKGSWFPCASLSSRLESSFCVLKWHLPLNEKHFLSLQSNLYTMQKAGTENKKYNKSILNTGAIFLIWNLFLLSSSGLTTQTPAKTANVPITSLGGLGRTEVFYSTFPMHLRLTSEMFKRSI